MEAIRKIRLLHRNREWALSFLKTYEYGAPGRQRWVAMLSDLLSR